MKKDLWQRAEKLFHAALELSPEARRAFLDKACSEDTELRNQIERLLSQDEQAGSFLEKPALAGAADMPGARGSLVGRQLGPYRILSSLGAGGMGEVYRARDSKLGRDVAVKTLTPQFSGDPERIARFQREAKLLASLNHPNIAAIYGLEESKGTGFLVLELVEGDTLADQIKAGPIPVEEALKLALQIAEALEAAHEKGVIHRDLKPANIKVTPDGKVKVLDFGLAKAFAGDQTELNLSNSPTLSYAATQQGVILGTAAYMSPEQAKGKTVDKKADIWAFGCVLYEMLTGQAAFQGEDVTEILAAVVKGGANLDLLPASLHPRVRELLTRCLQKDLKKRYHDIADVRYEIDQALADPGGVLAQPVTTVEPRKKLRTLLPWIAAILGIIIVGVAVWRLKPAPSPEPRQVIRFEYELPEGQQFSALNIAVSPDGKQFVYSTSKGLYVRSFDESAARLIAGTEGNTRQPFFSPDGKWIGYESVTDRKLKKIAVNGGPPVVLCDVSGHFGKGEWNEDDTIIYSDIGAVMRISAKGGTPESIAKREDRWIYSPQILPDGKSLMYTASPTTINKITVQSLKSGKAIELFRGVDSQYLPTGQIIYRSPDNSNLYAVPFSLDRLEVTGGHVTILENIKEYAFSESGTLAYIPQTSGGSVSRQTLVWVNREGKEEPLKAPPNQYRTVRISPDGTRVALTVGSIKNYHIWIWDLFREIPTQLTLDKNTDNIYPVWTPDGKRIVYTSSREDVLMGDLYWRASDGTGAAEKLAWLPGRGLFPWFLSQDGTILLLTEMSYPYLKTDIGMLSMEGNHAVKPLLRESASLGAPRISPNGKWMAYLSGEVGSGKTDVYVCPFPDVRKRKWQVSTGGANYPLWSPNSRELFYRNGDAIMAVGVETEPEFKPGKPTVLFRGEYYPGESVGAPTWDISPDGKRFLMIKEVESTSKPAAEAPRKINIVVNWLEELKQRVPGSKN
jgi:eukaryotic-like serine/threonine-protein kinase